MPLNRAYSLLEVKDLNDGERIIRGIATTPRPDRMQDIVEPMGVSVASEIPLFLYHDSTKTVGRAKFGKATKAGIPFEARIPKITEPGALKDRVDEAWQMVSYNLINAVSIGFRVIGDNYEMLKDGGVRFLETEVMELSLVPIPAQPDAVIQSIKAFDQKAHEALLKTIKSIDQETRRAALGTSGSPVVHLKSLPGVSGKNQPNSKGNDMKTIAEQIAAFEAKRASSIARREEIQTKAIDEGRSKDEAEKEEFDGLSAEIDSIDSELKDLKVMEKSVVDTATPIRAEVVTDAKSAAAARGGRGSITVHQNIAPGVKFARYAMALVRGKGNLNDALSIVQNEKRWMDQTPELAQVMKAAVAAGDTTTSGWASELVYNQNLAGEFIEYLRPMTILGRMTRLRQIPFNVRMGQQNGVSSGYWVGQGAPIPVSKPGVTSQSLGMAKCAGLVAIDEELARSSSPSAELMVRDDLAATISTFMDVQFVDPNVAAVANISPASVTHGVTAIVATGTDSDHLRTDLAALMKSMVDAELNIGDCVWIMTPNQALQINLMVNSLGLPLFPDIGIDGGKLLGIPVITSNSANIPGSPNSGCMIILANEREIFLADDGQVTVDVSREASIQMLDNPTNTSTGSTTATAMVSMFQTHSLALRATRFVNWAKRRTTAVSYIKEAAYVA